MTYHTRVPDDYIKEGVSRSRYYASTPYKPMPRGVIKNVLRSLHEEGNVECSVDAKATWHAPKALAVRIKEGVEIPFDYERRGLQAECYVVTPDGEWTEGAVHIMVARMIRPIGIYLRRKDGPQT